MNPHEINTLNQTDAQSNIIPDPLNGQSSMLHAILNSTEDLIFFKDLDGKYINCNQAYARHHGKEIADIRGLTSHDLHKPILANRFMEEDKEVMQTLKSMRYELLGRNSNGERVMLETIKSPYFDESNNLVGVVGIIRDITKRHNIELELSESRRYLRAILETSLDAFWVLDKDGNFLDFNSAFCQMCGYSRAELLKMNIEDLEILENRNAIEKRIHRILTEGRDRFETVHRKKDGTTYDIEIVSSLFDSEQSLVVGFARDISQNKEKSKRINFLSFHDHLTGLYNRRYIEDSIMRLDTNRNYPFTIMMLDVNGLKLTNDAFGHHTGDQVLVSVSEAIKKVCREDDIIGRIGGDEFVILLPKTDRSDAEKIRKRIEKTAAETDLDSVIVSVAIGYSIKNHPEQSIEEVMKEADSMMYRNKLRDGKSFRQKTIELILDNVNKKYGLEIYHTKKVSDYSRQLAIAMGYGGRIAEDVKKAGELHDIGKIILPAELLNKPEPLDPAEAELIKQHPEASYQILKSTDEYAYLAEIVLHHHERWDGSGYPEGLRGEEIPLLSRIIAVSDTYEALTSKRPYKEALDKSSAIQILNESAGTQLDPRMVKIFVEKVLS